MFVAPVAGSIPAFVASEFRRSLNVLTMMGEAKDRLAILSWCSIGTRFESLNENTIFIPLEERDEMCIGEHYLIWGVLVSTTNHVHFTLITCRSDHIP